MKITTQEYDALLEQAEQVINCLLDIIENQNIENLHQYEKNNLAKTDDWLKWKNGELMDTEVKAIFNYPIK